MIDLYIGSKKDSICRVYRETAVGKEHSRQLGKDFHCEVCSCATPSKSHSSLKYVYNCDEVLTHLHCFIESLV